MHSHEGRSSYLDMEQVGDREVTTAFGDLEKRSFSAIVRMGIDCNSSEKVKKNVLPQSFPEI